MAFGCSAVTLLVAAAALVLAIIGFDLAEQGVASVNSADAGAAVLGWDVRKLGSSVADRRLRHFLDESIDEYSPFVNAVIPPGMDDKRAGILDLLRSFRAGYEIRT
mgnify:CR=1 FL=1